jgi:Cys-tRNA synthase (O-phospho-L-seryl-tRNA:Cys-tRNA synthase)
VDIRYPGDAAEMLPGDEVRAVETARFAKAVVLRVLDEA